MERIEATSVQQITREITLLSHFSRGQFEEGMALIEANERSGISINLDCKDDLGRTALQFALLASENDQVVANVTYMFDHGATAAAPQEKGHLALHNYAFRAWTKGDASIDLFNLLVSRGASVDAISQCQDPPTGTPLQLASLLYELPQNAAHRERLVEVAMYLIGRGASTDLPRLSHHFMQRAQSLAANYTSRQDEAADGSVGGSA